jgi:serine phosphatase RsbU (regulator of sigma subunit)
LFYSDGLVEAHNQPREMFGSPRLKQLITEHDGETIERLPPRSALRLHR